MTEHATIFRTITKQHPNLASFVELARGANGVVYKVDDVFLKRSIAVKIWDKLRPSDRRDKLLQGMLESQTQARARSLNVVTPLFAGIANERYYCAMEFFDGISGKTWLQYPTNSLPARSFLAAKLCSEIFSVARSGVLHGDFISGTYS